MPAPAVGPCTAAQCYDIAKPAFFDLATHPQELILEELISLAITATLRSSDACSAIQLPEAVNSWLGK